MNKRTMTLLEIIKELNEGLYNCYKITNITEINKIEIMLLNDSNGDNVMTELEAEEKQIKKLFETYGLICF